jgi:hypothetical protein
MTVVVLFTSSAKAQTSAFTFQGSLNSNNIAANGTYDIQFALFDAMANGNQIGSAVTNPAVTVTNGIFTVPLDFGAGAFTGTDRYLQIGVRAAGSPDAHTLLTPRQPVTSAPYAVKSLNSATADNANQLGGVDANQYVTGQVVRSVNNLTDNVTLAAGSNITITPVGNTLTIASTGGGGSSGILNQTSQQTGANFNIDGTGSAAILNANTQYNIGGNRVLSVAGTQNFFAGIDSGTVTTGSSNAFVGFWAGRDNTSGQSNAFFGSGAGTSNTSGGANAFFGNAAGFSNTTAGGNTFVGVSAGRENTTGHSNSYFGIAAGVFNIAGTNNTFVGASAGGHDETATKTTLLGADTEVALGVTNAAAIGYQATVLQSNSLVLGSIKNVNGASESTKVGIGTAIPRTPLHILDRDNNGNILFGGGGCGSGFGGIGFGSSLSNCDNYSLLGNGANTMINRPAGGTIYFRLANTTQMSINPSGTVTINTLGGAGSTQLCRNASNQISTCSSSLRYKTNIAPFSSGLNLVNRLRPITFDWKDGGMHDLGLGAEVVAAVEPLLVHYNDKGEVEGVKYDRIGVVVLNAIKEQQTQIEQQQKQIQQQQLIIDSLKKLVCRTNAQVEECKEDK